MWLACAMVLLGSATRAATIYKWVDENGVVHYSDQPHPNAEKLTVHAAQTYRAADSAVGQPSGPLAPPPSAPDTSPYLGCAIVQPSDDQTFTNIDSLSIVVRTDPNLRQGDQIFMLLDGAALNNNAPTGPQYLLSPVDRGTHTLQALVRGNDGALMCQTPSVTFNVHQPSLLAPGNPLRHH